LAPLLLRSVKNNKDICVLKLEPGMPDRLKINREGGETGGKSDGSVADGMVGGFLASL